MRYNSLVEVYRDALGVQDACNLGAIVKALDNMITYLRTRPECTGTDWINQHPAVQLVCDKLVDLARCREMDTFHKAYGTALDTIAEEEQKTKMQKVKV